MTEQELADFDAASNHLFECKCALCVKWWKACGPEREDDETSAGYGPFGDVLPDTGADYMNPATGTPAVAPEATRPAFSAGTLDREVGQGTGVTTPGLDASGVLLGIASDLAYIRWALARELRDFKDGTSTAEEVLSAIEALIDAKKR